MKRPRLVAYRVLLLLLPASLGSSALARTLKFQHQEKSTPTGLRLPAQGFRTLGHRHPLRSQPQRGCGAIYRETLWLHGITDDARG